MLFLAFTQSLFVLANGIFRGFLQKIAFFGFLLYFFPKSRIALSG